MIMHIDEEIILAPLTSLGIGGPARYLARCRTTAELIEALEFAARRDLPVHVLGGGSNSLFADEGLRGLVVRVELAGVHIDVQGDAAIVTTAAGEEWDALVARTVADGLAGIECLSGIPGLVGATPIQNVGAYGQEISECLVEVQALDRRRLNTVTFAAAECGFAYRHSRFKGRDRQRYIITGITCRLRTDGRPRIRYPELRGHLEAAGIEIDHLETGVQACTAVREAVVRLRRSKGMVLDPGDANTRSAGSFFLNPVLTAAQFERASRRWASRAGAGAARIPSYPVHLDPGADGTIRAEARPAGELVHTVPAHKIPAAWLVEQAGFPRGTRVDGAAVSDYHALALVSRSGRAGDLLCLAARIQGRVESVFGIRLQREPVRVRPDGSVAAADDNE